MFPQTREPRQVVIQRLGRSCSEDLAEEVDVLELWSLLLEHPLLYAELVQISAPGKAGVEVWAKLHRSLASAEDFPRARGPDVDLLILSFYRENVPPKRERTLCWYCSMSRRIWCP